MTTPATAAVNDGLANVMTGAGTSVDRTSHRFYVMQERNPQQLEAAYRTSWLVRKIVNIPADDMTRIWRNWQATPEQRTALEKEERRLCLEAKIQKAITWQRLFGGAAIVMGFGDGDPSQPAPPVTQAGGLRYLHVVSRWKLGESGQTIDDPESPYFEEPTMWMLGSKSIHPSRVIPLRGMPPTDTGYTAASSRFWGDSVLQPVMDAVANADAAQGGFASLIEEAKIDVINIPDLMSQVGGQDYEAKLMRRLLLAQQSKSVHRALILDGAETWSQKQVSWTGIPDILAKYLEIVAGAADIPVTRLLGQSPGGLNSTGKGEERDYLAMIDARRASDLRPALERLDQYLIPSALGSLPDEIHFTFPSLVPQAPKQDAETEKLHAETLAAYVNAGLVPEDVASQAAESRLIEMGHWPGIEQAYAEAEAEGEALPGDDPEGDDAAANMNDAAPRTLYVSRPVLNRGELQEWATAQGLGELQDDLHVTIAYSKAPLDWMKIESDWNQDQAGQIIVAPGGVRIVEPLGSKTAVLLFTSSHLSWRHQSIINAGASHDYPDYQPHISLTEAQVDLAAVEPYRGQILLGPERFEEAKV